ncbi:kinase-like domain-containing protein [Rhizophagus clarus]|uniref:Kinase-like domain-containing protein n=1 Tax=Rhizophagus clarus TaxID=94130 RepID=A0A8H3LMT5_9GLOM|nr:kinase-like domain-containing protein [Rhizophagus clarus]
MEEKPKNLWKGVVGDYQLHVTISTSESEDVDESVVYMEDLEKRKQVYGICGECKEPEGGFGKIYSAEWPEGYIYYWDIENQKWHRDYWDKYVLKSLKNSSNISSDFLNEIKSYLQIYLYDIIQCYGITQDPNTREPTTKELLEILTKWVNETDDRKGIIYFQTKECDKIGEKKFKNRLNESKSKSIQTHPQAIYTSRLLNFKNLPKPVNSTDLSAIQINSDITSECLDCLIK